MTRRNFFWAKVAGLLSLRLEGRAAQAGAPSTGPLPRARWIKNGLIDAGGSHEPYTFEVRRGGQRLDAYQGYQRAQSEEVIKGLKESGVEVFHTHFYKGAGMAHEKAEMEDTKRVAGIVHRYGMKIDTYLQWNTMLYEPFFAEEPRAKNWVQRDIYGVPILLRYGFQQSFRYRPCFSNPEYLEYLGKLVRYCVGEVKTDFIHFDNFDLSPEPDSCHCPSCVQGFRNFLRKKYSREKLRERFGFDNVDYVNPPQWNAPNPPQRLQIIFDPGIQEWIDYRCQSMTDALRQMATLAKSINPEVVIEVNPHGITGGNRAWEAGLDHARFLKYTEVFWTEERNLPAYMSDGRLISTIRSLKLARAFDNILLTYTTESEAAMAECLAFNQTIGSAGGYPLRPSMQKYVQFYRNNRDLFVGTKDVATVALLRSYASIAYNHAVTQLSAILMEQALIQTRIPFDLVFDEHLADLSKYKVLVLPDSECLSDEQLGYIRRFVENGGGLLVSGQAGLYDEWRRVRVQPGLAGLVDGQRMPRGYQENVMQEQVSGSGTRKEVGKGRVVYFPAIQFDGQMPPYGNYFEIRNQYWKLPKNYQELTDGVRWAAKDDIPVTISGPLYLVANVVEQRDKRRIMVHLMNYNVRNVPKVESVKVACRLPGGAAAKGVKAYSPDMDTPQSLDVTAGSSGSSFTVPEVKTYTMLVVNY
jgi:glycosyl hydrolase family 42 (putative beta-galactosidase)